MAGMKNWVLATALIAATTAMSPLAGAATIGTWSADAAYAGTGASVTGSGSSATWTRGTGNAAIVAPFTSTTLGVGDSITLSGTMAFSSGTSFTDLGNEQLRFGVFNAPNVNASTGWLGYMAEVPNSNSGVIQADTANGGNWASSGGGTLLTTTNSGTFTKPGSAAAPYAFSLTITNGAAGQSIIGSFTSSDGTTYTYTGSATDTSSAAALNSTYNAIGFFDGGTGMGTSPEVDLSNITVTTSSAVPEPASLGLLAVGAAGLFLRKRRTA